MQSNPVLIVERISEDAQIPKYADNFAEGMDLYSPEYLTIQPNSKQNIKLGIKVRIPDGYWLKFESRSGTSWKNSIEVGAGIIDNNYTQELGLVLYNHDNQPFHIAKGDRIAQAILMKRNIAAITEGTVEDTGRGGFGSTGK